MPGKKLFLIDGSAIAYRSYFAFINNPLINSKGQNTSAVFGFLRFLYMIYDNEQPDYLAVVFDPKGKTVRHGMYAEYKATRQKMPDDMREQIPQIHATLTAMNIPIIEVEGYEADDVVGTLAKRAGAQGFETFLVSGDKDFMQLVNDKTKLYNPKRAGEAVEILDVSGVEKKVGLPPGKIVDYLALMGDTSDNVPGVRGVGEKTAVSLILEYGDVENVLANAEKVSRKNVRENLLAHREDALLSKKLVAIDVDVPVEADLESFLRKEPDSEKLTELFRKFEFTSLLERVEGSRGTRKARYAAVETREQLERLLAALESARMIVVDLETSSPDPMRAEIVGMSFSVRPLEAFYLPLKIERHDGSVDLCLRNDVDLFGGFSVTHLLKPILEDETSSKAGHNIKYDMLVLRRHGILLRGIAFDTMIASYLINPTFRQHNLDALALEYLNYKKISVKDLLGTGKGQITMAEVNKDELLRYACEDADITCKLAEIFAPKLRENNLQDLFEQVDRPLIEVLADVEEAGVSLDLDFLAAMSRDMAKQLDLLVGQIYDMAGEEFNINSTQQLGEILFEKLSLPRKKKTKTGYSTDARVLEELAKVHELPKTLLEYRELTKLKSTYVDALPNLVNPETGRLHTSYNQTVAATGRLSSSDPNLQNIPIRTDLGREIRRAFVPEDKDHVILDADYSQIELRVMAHLSRDPVLLESFQNEEDIHAKTAAIVFNIAPEEINAEHRRRAKEINFGIMYGMGVFGLATRLKISNEEARAFIDSYFIQYQKVHEFIYLMHRQVEEKGYVMTLLNRRRYLPEINSKNYNIREFAKRTAVNTPIQGTAAELIKLAMLNIWRRLKGEKLGSRMIMQVHDELVFEVPVAEVDYMKELVRTEMEGAMSLDVPIKAEVGVGNNWLEAH